MDFAAFVSEAGWNGETGWSKDAQDGLKEIEGDDLESLKMSAGIDPIAAIMNQDGQAAFEAAGDQEFDGKTYDAVNAVNVGFELTFFLDKKTKLIAAMTAKRDDPNLGGDYVLKVTYDDYKAVAGVQLPHKTVHDIADGTLILTMTYTETTVNQPIDNKLFEKPVDIFTGFQ